MKRNLNLALAAALSMTAAVAGAQTIDKPVATVKLVRQEIYSQRQFKADVEKIEAGIKQKLPPDARRNLVENQVNSMLFRQYCEREKIIVSDAEVNAAVAEMKGQLGPGADDAAMESALRAQGIVVDARTYARQQLLISRYIQLKRADDLKTLKGPTPDDILKTYELMKSTLVRPDTARVSVVYSDLRGKSAEDRKQATELFRSMSAQVRNNSSKFDDYLLKAIDPSAGYKATVSVMIEKTPQMQGVYGPAFLDAVFKLKQGEVSGLIENEAGVQIARLNEFLPQKQLTLSDTVPGQQNATVQDYIAYQLAMKGRNELLAKIQEDLIAQLRKEASVKVYEENLNF